MLTTDLARSWLRAALRARRVERKLFNLGSAVQDEVVTTNRLILILSGKLDYTVEDRSIRMKEGTQFFVPAWVRRVWSVPRGGPCEIIWCEFDDGGVESGWKTVQRKTPTPTEWRAAKKGFQELLLLYSQRKTEEDTWTGLQMEAQLKMLLIGFLENAKTPSVDEVNTLDIHTRVKAMLIWLGEHFQKENVLELLYRDCGMTRNYFRKHFTEAMQCPPQTHIERLRLRHARYLLNRGEHSVKEVAAACGFGDALYFSRVYRRFWGRPPGREIRRRSG